MAVGSTEERVARLEARSELENASAQRLEHRLDNIEQTLNELAMDMHSAKTAGKLALGAATIVGGAIGVLSQWLLKGKV